MLAELQALAEGLAARMNRGVAIDDPNFRLIVHTAHHGPVDETRLESILRLRPPEDVLRYIQSLHLERMSGTVTRLHAVESLGMLARVLAPVRSGSQTFGFLSLIDADESLAEADLAVIAEVAQSAASVMERDSLFEELRAGRRRELLRDVLSTDAELRASAADELDGLQAGLSGPVQALIVRIPTSQVPAGRDLTTTVEAALDRAARRTLTRRCLYLSRATHGLLVVPTRGLEASDLDRVAAAAVSEVSAGVGAEGVHSALGEPVERVSDLARSYEQAQLALRVAQLVSTFGTHVAWSQLGVYRTLVHLPLDSLPEDSIPAELTSLQDAAGGEDLLRTVEVYLDEAGDVRRTIGRLAIHRTSLYYRLNRFFDLTGLDLRRGEERLSVHLGLKLARLRGTIRVKLPPPSLTETGDPASSAVVRHLS